MGLAASALSGGDHYADGTAGAGFRYGRIKLVAKRINARMETDCHVARHRRFGDQPVMANTLIAAVTIGTKAIINALNVGQRISQVQSYHGKKFQQIFYLPRNLN